MRYISCLPHLSCNHPLEWNCRTDEASLTASFKRSLIGGSGRDSSLASDTTLADVNGGLGTHTRCLFFLLARTPAKVSISVISRMAEQKHIMIFSGTLGTGELST